MALVREALLDVLRKLILLNKYCLHFYLNKVDQINKLNSFYKFMRDNIEMSKIHLLKLKQLNWAI